MSTTKQSADYARHLAKMRTKQRTQAAAAAELGRLPAVENPARKIAALRSLRTFAETYFQHLFPLPWSDDHLIALARIEQAATAGGLFAVALPRGQGKTTIAETGTLWAVSSGRRRFPMLIGSDEQHAVDMLDALKKELATNELYAADFPEICFPSVALDNKPQRAAGQKYHGRPTFIGWTQNRIVFPTIAGSQAAGAVVQVAGLTGHIRGTKYKTPAGPTIRPDLAILDDPQTDESARSPTQCASRERIILGAVLGLAGPGQKMAAVMPCTVIAKNDLADSFLNHERHPDWQGLRRKMLTAWPRSMKRWHEYGQIRNQAFRDMKGPAPANDYYAAHRAEMDEGAAVSWPARIEPGDLSAIQTALNFWLRDPAAFASEYQNEPAEEKAEVDTLTAAQITAKCVGLPRGEIPLDAAHLVLGIDVQKALLYWTVCAFAPDFTGAVVAYGAYPEQDAPYFTLKQARRTIARRHAGANFEAQLFAALQTLTAELHAMPWRSADGSRLAIDLTLIDANWQESKETIYQWCHATDIPNAHPAHGRYIGAKTKPFNEQPRKTGDRIGLNWKMPRMREKRIPRYVAFDANYYKSFRHARLASPIGEPGSLTLYGRPGSPPPEHRMFADHQLAEYATAVEAHGRLVIEYQLRPNKPDNHFLDTLTLCCVAGSIAGAKLPGLDREIYRRRELNKGPRPKLSEM